MGYSCSGKRTLTLTAFLSLFVFELEGCCVLDRRTDGRTDGRTDEGSRPVMRPCRVITVASVASWQRGAGGKSPHPANLASRKISILVGKFASKNAKFGSRDPPFWGNLGSKSETVCTVGDLPSVGNLQALSLEPTTSLSSICFMTVS